MVNMSLKIRVYISNLSAYVEGELIGKWVDLPIDEDELQKEINSILRNGDEEYAIHDYEAPFPISEHDNPFELNRQLDELDNFDIDIDDDELEALMEIMNDLSEAVEALRAEKVHFHHVEKDGWIGWKDFAEYMVYECDYLDVPKHLLSYIDFEQVGIDLEHCGLYHIAENGIIVEEDVT